MPLPRPVDGPTPDANDTSAMMDAVQTELRAWRTAHPQATFADIEAAVEATLARLRAQLIAATLLPPDPQVVPPHPVAAPDAPPARPTCPTCAVPLQSRGRQSRTLRVVGDQPVTLQRSYWTCPQCGDGLFPPG